MSPTAATSEPATRPHRRPTRGALLLIGILVAAFALRLALRVALGEASFWSGYTLFDRLAQSVVAGDGLRLGPDYFGGASQNWAVRQPLYPLFLAGVYVCGGDWLAIVVLQAVFGAVVAACGYWLGRRWFGEAAGLLAAAMAAVYPYYALHDTALQDTGMVDAGAALALCLLLQARTSRRAWMWLAAGLAAGLIVLIRGTLLPFGAAALVWLALAGEGPVRMRWRRAAVAAIACIAAVGVWMARNEIRVGAPVLSTEIGREFSDANGPYTFSYYPDRSIDLSALAAARSLSRADRQAVSALSEAGRSGWFLRRGLAYVAAHPADTLLGAVRKEAAGFSPILNPLRDRLTELAYTASYTPVLLLGLVGMVMAARRGWREQSLVWLQFAGFALVTAIFWAATSHRVYLDVYLMVFAAPVILRAAGWLRARFGGLRSRAAPQPA